MLKKNVTFGYYYYASGYLIQQYYEEKFHMNK